MGIVPMRESRHRRLFLHHHHFTNRAGFYLRDFKMRSNHTTAVRFDDILTICISENVAKKAFSQKKI